MNDKSALFWIMTLWQFNWLKTHKDNPNLTLRGWQEVVLCIVFFFRKFMVYMETGLKIFFLLQVRFCFLQWDACTGRYMCVSNAAINYISAKMMIHNDGVGVRGFGWLILIMFYCFQYSSAFHFTLRLRQNGRQLPDNIFKCISWMKMYKFWLRFHWCLFPRVQLTIFQHWFR